MRKIFWDNPYQHHLKTTVTTVNHDVVLFAKTIAFSFSGGQESDKAFVGGLPILHSEIDGTLIYYTLPKGHNFQPGQTVEMTIDWPRRYRLMRLHFAAELVLELVSKLGQFKKIGAHIGEAKSRIDFICPDNISTAFEQILAEFNQVIRANLPIKTGYIDINNQRRFWEIDGFARVPCGGTHVKSTAEVGYISLKRVNIGRGKERIEITLLDNNLGLT